MADPMNSATMPYRRWLRAIAFTALVVVLIAIGVTEEFGLRTLLIVVAVFSGSALFLWLFHGTRFFVLAFANSLAIYTCIYFFLASANFAHAEPLMFAIGFLLPIYAFIAGAWWRRDEIRRIVTAQHLVEERHLGRISAWLLPVIILGTLTFFVPDLGLDHEGTGLVLVAAMALTALFVMAVSREVCIFLVDTGLLFDQLFIRILNLLAPTFAFLTLYSFNVIVFAMIYRIIDKLSDTPAFLIDGARRTIGFSESLYFSLMTVSTVGYGDIVPVSDPVRLVSAIEVVIGLLLLLFGFREVFNYARDGRRDERG